MKQGIIYLVTNKINSKKYIGQTTQPLSYRWSEHKHRSKKSQVFLYRSIRKYGIEAFTCEVIAETLKPFLDNLEIFFIRLYNSHYTASGYNRTFGGDSRTGHSEEAIVKMRAAKLGKKLTEEHKAKIGVALMGRQISQETREKISKRLMFNTNGRAKSKAS